MANPGQVGDTGNDGGAGYSGGGEFIKYSDSGYKGGSDGSAGEGRRGEGGSGTGEDISEYVFTTWTLTPGAGGSPIGCGPSAANQCGGGGGGVLVDGAGPDTDYPSTKGKGYGGGGNGRTDPGFDIGLQGIILLEISSA